MADDVVVRGLAIGRFNFNGIEVDNVEGLGIPSSVRIQGNSSLIASAVERRVRSSCSSRPGPSPESA